MAEPFKEPNQHEIHRMTERFRRLISLPGAKCTYSVDRDFSDGFDFGTRSRVRTMLDRRAYTMTVDAESFGPDREPDDVPAGRIRVAIPEQGTVGHLAPEVADRLTHGDVVSFDGGINVLRVLRRQWVSDRWTIVVEDLTAAERADAERNAALVSRLTKVPHGA